MSVLIKDMKMPENCLYCKLTDSEYCTCVLMDFYNDDYYVGKYNKERAPFCPLVEVPTPHGKLIDANILEKDIEKYHLSDGKFQHWMQVQNSIIEAEEGKTDVNID